MNLKSTLTDALELLGCEPGRFQFDDQSTIAMSFNDIGDVLLDPLDGHVWIWVALPEMPLSAIGGRAMDLLEALSEPNEFLSSGCLALRNLGERHFIGGPLLESCVDNASNLSMALEHFYERALAIFELVK